MLGQLPTSEGTTVIVVTHDRAVAATTDVQFTLEDGVLTEAA
jgi:ABC-type lipoprotein export system ATPase subunit